jgi:DNA-binding transcriptional LysR family regulator
VRIGVPDGVGVGFLASRLALFAASQPGLAIELVAVPRVFNLTKREADIAISLGRPAKGRLIGRKLKDYSLQLYASKTYLSKHSKIQRPSDLLNHMMIGYIEDLTPIPELSYLDEIHSSLKPAFASSTMIVQLEAIRAGAGVGVLPRFLAEPCKELVCVLPETVRLVRTFWLSVHADLHRLARIRVLCDFIANQIQDESALFS